MAAALPNVSQGSEVPVATLSGKVLDLGLMTRTEILKARMQCRPHDAVCASVTAYAQRSFGCRNVHVRERADTRAGHISSRGTVTPAGRQDEGGRALGKGTSVPSESVHSLSRLNRELTRVWERVSLAGWAFGDSTVHLGFSESAAATRLAVVVSTGLASPGPGSLAPALPA